MMGAARLRLRPMTMDVRGALRAGAESVRRPASRGAAAVALLAVVLLAACEGPFIPATLINDIYPYNLDTTPPRVLRWEDGSRVRVFVAADLPERRALLENAFAAGAAEWNSRALYSDYEIVRAASLTEADVLLRWSDEPAAVDMSSCEPVLALAVTTFCLSDADPTRLATFPLLPPQVGTSSVKMVVTVLGTLASTQQTVQNLVAHELGHVLGIGQHSSVASDLMYGGTITRSTLSRRDAATVQALYRTEPHIQP